MNNTSHETGFNASLALFALMGLLLIWSGFHNITHLMEKVKARGGRVGCFPVGEKAWRDMGEWPEYLKMINVR